MSTSPGIDIGSLLANLAPTAAQGLAAYIQQQQQNSAKNYIEGIGQTGVNQDQASGAMGQGVLGQANTGLSSILSGSNPYMQQLSGGLLPNIQTLNNLLPSLVQGGNQNLPAYAGQPANQIYQDPTASAALGNITGLNSNTSGLLDWASQMINNGGQTNSQNPLGAYSSSLMGGSNPLQSALGSAGTGTLASGGMTPALSSALQQAMGVVGSGGANPLTNQLAQTGLNLANVNGGNPLLSMNQLASFVQDQSGRNYANAAATGRAQAQARGQGAGDIVASGTGNQAIADSSDQALAGSATAMQNALAGQQGLNLQQVAQGLNTGLSAADIQRSLELGGLSSVAGLTGAQTGLLNTGGSLTNSALGASNTGASLYDQLLGLQQSNTQQGLNTALSGINAQQGVNQTSLQDILQGQTGQANLGNMLSQLYLGNQSQYGNAINSGINANTTATGQLNTQGNDWLNYALGGLSTAGSTSNAIAQLFKTPNAISTFVNNLGSKVTPGTSAGSGGQTGSTSNSSTTTVTGPEGNGGGGGNGGGPGSGSGNGTGGGGIGTANSTVTYPTDPPASGGGVGDGNDDSSDLLSRYNVGASVSPRAASTLGSTS